MRGVARAPGTCGELLQGTLNDMHIHVTCPVNLYSTVEVILKPGQSDITVNQPYSKVQAAIAKTLAFWGLPNCGAEAWVQSALPVGKGMASSTADITAACVAASEAVGKFIAPADIARIALSIEPTDGLMFPGLVLFDHVAGKNYRQMAKPPEINIMVIDTGGTVDTGEFNARGNLPALNRQKEKTIRQALKVMEEGLTTGDAHKIGQAATMSALANQQTINKPELDEIIAIARAFDALGVNTAHSGTVLGILYNRDLTDKAALLEKLLMYNKAFQLIDCSLIGGGAEIPAAERGESFWRPYNTYMVETFRQQQQSMG